MGLFSQIEKIFHGKGQHCHFPVTVHFRIGDSHGPNGHAPRTGNMPMGRSSQTLNCTQFFLLVLFHHHHLISVHWSPFHVLLYIRLDLVLSIGLAPDFGSLGPYQIFGLVLWAVPTLLRPAPSSQQETLLVQCSWGNAD